MARAVPLYRSLLVRLLAASCLIAGCAIAATAWIAASTATSALARQQGQTLEADGEIVTQLSGYAVAHADWSGVEPLLRQLSERFQLRIALVGTDGKTITDSAAEPPPAPLPPSATATIDPLSFDSSTAGVQRPGLDPRVTGPYLLTPEEADFQRVVAEKGVSCLTKHGVQAQATALPTGRYLIQSDHVPQTADTYCGNPEMLLSAPAQTEKKPLADLATAIAACLARQGLPIPHALSVSPAFELRALVPRGETAEQEQQCMRTARVEQLRPYVAAPAQLYLGIGTTAAREHFNLSGQNRSKIIWTAAVVLAVTLAVTTLVGLRLVRPLRALIHAARQDPGAFARAPVTTRDETGYLAMAFNELTERRQQMDAQRKAMVADIAHELRSPLTNIRGWLEVTRDGLVEATPELITSLHDEALVLQHIIDDLQDLASADAGTLRVHPQVLPALEVLQQVAVAHRAQAADAGIAVAVQAEARLEVFADPARIRQVLGNLVSNAVRHTASGGSVTLAARAGEGFVELSVQDTGCGIAEAELPLIFDRFWRSEKSRSRSTGGSGLGLAIARHLVLAHGGTLRAESVVGVGTTMTVRLPGQVEAER